jgi:hypothetical protein
MPTTPEARPILVCQWQKGEPRPGSVHKRRVDTFDFVEVPPDGQAPNVGDVLGLPDPTGKEPLVHFRVVGREHEWVRTRAESAQVPARYSRMILHVRRLSDEEYEEYAAEP